MAHSLDCKACKKIKLSIMNQIREKEELALKKIKFEEENIKKKKFLETSEFIEKHKELDEKANSQKSKTMGERLQDEIERIQKEEKLELINVPNENEKSTLDALNKFLSEEYKKLATTDPILKENETPSLNEEFITLKDEINKLKEEFEKLSQVENERKEGFIKYGKKPEENPEVHTIEAQQGVIANFNLRKFLIKFEASSRKILLLSDNQETLDWNNKNGNKMNTILQTTVEPYLSKPVTTELLKSFSDKLYSVLIIEFPDEIFQLTYLKV